VSRGKRTVCDETGWSRVSGLAAERTDAELLAEWAAGVNTAGHALFAKHFAAIRRFFLNKAGQDTEDLVHETFLRALQTRQRFAGKSSFRTFLFGISRNVLFEYIRAKGRQARFDPDELSLEQAGTSPSGLVARREEHRILRDGLRRIPMDAQIILELFYWERLTGPELGAVLEVPENTARSRLRRARELLEVAIRSTSAPSITPDFAAADLDEWASSLRGDAALDGAGLTDAAPPL
jgi:RNA polymerase sigma factor (sigma-70 family)